jgi:uncharacterized protein (DUF2062 family)
MFKRKNPLPPSQLFLSILWPQMGWKRMGRYIQLRLIRLKETTRSIATGFAFGASVSFTPLPGIHIFSAAGLSFITRGSVLASVVGTLVGNPWTLPLMWWGAYKMGNFAFSLFGANISAMPEHFTWDYLMDEIAHHPMDLIVPWVTGGIILMVLSWPIFYIVAYRMVAKLRRKHNRHNHT